MFLRFSIGCAGVGDVRLWFSSLVRCFDDMFIACLFRSEGCRAGEALVGFDVGVDQFVIFQALFRQQPEWKKSGK